MSALLCLALLLPARAARAETYDVPALAASTGPFITAYFSVRIIDLHDGDYRVSLNSLTPGATSQGFFTDTDIMAYVISGSAEMRPPRHAPAVRLAELQNRGQSYAAGRFLLLPRGTFKPSLLAHGEPLLAAAVRYPSPLKLRPPGSPARPPFVDPDARVLTLALDELPGAARPPAPGTLRWLDLPGTASMRARRLDLAGRLGPRRVPERELVYIVHAGRVRGALSGAGFALGRGGVLRVPAGEEHSLEPAGGAPAALVEVSVPAAGR